MPRCRSRCRLRAQPTVIDLHTRSRLLLRNLQVWYSDTLYTECYAPSCRAGGCMEACLEDRK